MRLDGKVPIVTGAAKGIGAAIVEACAGDFAPIDPERWAKERCYHEASLPDVLGALRARRQASLDLLASVSPETLTGSRPHQRLGRLSGLDILTAWVAHDRIHLAQLAGTLARIWALRWAPLRADYAGPIPYSPDPQGRPS